MIFNIYGKALAVLAKKPFKLWGISLLCNFVLVPTAWLLGGPVLLIGYVGAYLLLAAMANIFLKGYHGEEDFHAVDLFNTFKDWKTAKRVVCALAWVDLWTGLWLLIPFAGPVFFIIKIYEYRLAPYIVMEEEDVSATKVKERSSELTKGYKSKMFWADVLFYVLTGAICLVLFLFSQIRYIGPLFGLILFLFAICILAFGGLFLGLVHAAFYDEITGAKNNAVYVDAPADPAPAEEPAPETTTEQ